VSRLAYALLMACAAASGFQPQTGLTDPEREKDVYAIYSLMLTNPETSHGPYDGDRLLIQMTTKPPSVHPSCVRPPRDREAEFPEVLAGRRVGLLHSFGRLLQSGRNAGTDCSLLLVRGTMRAISVESIREVGYRQVGRAPVEIVR
jgi:hypothetical protein